MQVLSQNLADSSPLRVLRGLEASATTATSPDLDSCSSLQGSQNRAQFSNWLCYELSGVCKTKPPPLAKGRKPGPAFQAIDPKEAEMEKMLAGMKVAYTTYTHLFLPRCNIEAWGHP